MWNSFVAFLQNPLNSSPEDVFLIVGVILVCLLLWHMIFHGIDRLEKVASE